MYHKNNVLRCILLTIGMLFLIFDGKTVFQGAKEGLELCLQTVIPSLFPFFFISGMLTFSVTRLPMPFLKPLGRLTGIPHGAEGILLIGMLGGYPIGASSIALAHKSGSLSKENAERMLGFCNNAGPAFIFGLITSLFDETHICWIIWGIQILSSLTAGAFLPGRKQETCSLIQETESNPFANSIKAMASVCGWIILFRVIIAIMAKHILCRLPLEVSILITGILELTNGCIDVYMISSKRLQFVMLSSMLSLGGFCVALQTASVTQGLSKRYYYAGKLFQALLALLIAIPLSAILFPGNH